MSVDWDDAVVAVVVAAAACMAVDRIGSGRKKLATLRDDQWATQGLHASLV